MITYTIRLHGSGLTGERISAALLRDLLDVLTDGAQGALRMQAEGRSTAPGKQPKWLGQAADFDLVAIEEGSTVLRFEAHSLRGALPEWDQEELFLKTLVDRGAVGLVIDSLRDACNGVVDSDRFDHALLGRFQGLTKVFAHGVDTVEFTNGASEEPLLSVNPDRLETVKQLHQATPPNRHVRVMGRLDQIRHSDLMFTLELENGPTLRGVAEKVNPSKLSACWGRRAVVVGTAVFRPSGRVLRLEAEDILPAGEADAVWSTEPKPLFQSSAPSVRQAQGPRTGINAVIGAWPGDETDAEVDEALRELS